MLSAQELGLGTVKSKGSCLHSQSLTHVPPLALQFEHCMAQPYTCSWENALSQRLWPKKRRKEACNVANVN